MDGFGVFIYICFGAAVLLVITSILLKRNKFDKYINKTFGGMLFLSIGIIVISFFVGGWTGMGYGFIGLSILIGTIIGRLIFKMVD